VPPHGLHAEGELPSVQELLHSAAIGAFLTPRTQCTTPPTGLHGISSLEVDYFAKYTTTSYHDFMLCCNTVAERLNQIFRITLVEREAHVWFPRFGQGNSPPECLNNRRYIRVLDSFYCLLNIQILHTLLQSDRKNIALIISFIVLSNCFFCACRDYWTRICAKCVRIWCSAHTKPGGSLTTIHGHWFNNSRPRDSFNGKPRGLSICEHPLNHEGFGGVHYYLLVGCSRHHKPCKNESAKSSFFGCLEKWSCHT